MAIPAAASAGFLHHREGRRQRQMPDRGARGPPGRGAQEIAIATTMTRRTPRRARDPSAEPLHEIPWSLVCHRRLTPPGDMRPGPSLDRSCGRVQRPPRRDGARRAARQAGGACYSAPPQREGAAMKHLVTAALAWAAIALPAAAETIRVGMSGGYFPFTFVRQDQLQGFEVDFMNAVAAETGDTVEFSTMAFSGLIGALEAGRLDTVANQITITPEREAKFVFTQPYVYDGAQVVVREGNEDDQGRRGPARQDRRGQPRLELRAAAARAALRRRDRHQDLREQHRAGHRARPGRRLRDGPGLLGAGHRRVAAAAPARRPALLRDPERAALPQRRGRAARCATGWTRRSPRSRRTASCGRSRRSGSAPT